jgi:hypothetical protein
MTGSMTGRSPLAALIYRADDDVDAVLRAVRDAVAAQGFRIGGLLQSPCDGAIFVTELVSGRRINITQELGACAEGCRLDTGALAEAAGLVARSLADPPDLLLLARFGKVEIDGGGVLAEIGEAASAGVPILVGVADKRVNGWRAFAGDLAEHLPCALAPALDWWKAVAPKR